MHKENTSYPRKVFSHRLKTYVLLRKGSSSNHHFSEASKGILQNKLVASGLASWEPSHIPLKYGTFETLSRWFFPFPRRKIWYSWSSHTHATKSLGDLFPMACPEARIAWGVRWTTSFLARFWSNPGDNLIRGFAISCPESFQIIIIIIFHQPRFLWNKGISLPQLPFEVRSCEVAIIWPGTSLSSCQRYVRMMFKPKRDIKRKPCLTRNFKQSIHYCLQWIGESNKIEG